MGRPLKKDEEVTHFALKFVTPILVLFIAAAVSDVFSLARWTGSLVRTNFWEYLPSWLS
ncbi:MAG: hypothetical protein WCJ25_01785 [Candidatus Moraniibacteriota bacterium]